MADDNKISGVSPQSAVTQTPKTAATSGSATGLSSKNEQISQQEFLTLLVHQLQNQDPLNPMDSQEFAVQLAQFSSLEQLVQINKKLDDPAQGTNQMSSMASFLGQEVALENQGVTMQGGEGPNLLVDFPGDVQSARVDLTNADGQIVGSFQLADIEGGQQSIKLSGLQIPNGTYDTRVVAVNGSGQFVDVPNKITGTVEGFVLEPTPALIVNGNQVALEDVKEVYYGGKS